MTRNLTDLDPKKILVCQLKQIGDVVLATPAIRMLKERWPGADISVLTEKRSAPMLANNPNISKIWAIDKKVLRNFFKALAWYWKVGRQGYDLVVDFQQLPRCRFVVAFSRAPVRLTYPPPLYNRLWYTDWIRPLDGYSAMSKASLLRALGLEYRDERPEIFITDQEKSRAREFLAERGVEDGHTLVTADVTHWDETRRWPAEYYGELMNLTAEVRPDVRFLLLYGPGERDTAEEVFAAANRKNCLHPEDVHDLRMVAALIERADLHIGNCSAPRHFAVGVGTRSMIIMGGSSQSWMFPSPEHNQIYLDLECQPCKQRPCPRGDLACLREFTPGLVLRHFRKNLPPAKTP